MKEADVIVVGGGIVGLWTCYQLLDKGQKCTLIEQFQLPHDHGSSFGESRIIRNSYLVEEYAKMMPENFSYWNKLQQTANKQLFLNTGLLSVFPNKNDEFRQILKILEKIKAPYKVLDSMEMNKMYSGLTTKESMIGLLDLQAGILKADDCIKELKKCILKAGGEIYTNEKVKEVIVSNSKSVIIQTQNESFHGKKVILACGPWTNEVLKSLDGFQLPLQVWSVNVRYWKAKTNNVNSYAMPEFPVISFYTKPFVYMIPSYDDHALIKMCLHPSNETTIKPDDKCTKHDRDLESLKGVISNYLRNINPEPAYTEHCIYTMSPDNGFILDIHPKYPQVLLAAGFSGHGFKTAPVVGKLLAKMACGEQNDYPINPYSIQRKGNKMSKL